MTVVPHYAKITVASSIVLNSLNPLIANEFDYNFHVKSKVNDDVSKMSGNAACDDPEVKPVTYGKPYRMADVKPGHIVRLSDSFRIF